MFQVYLEYFFDTEDRHSTFSLRVQQTRGCVLPGFKTINQTFIWTLCRKIYRPPSTRGWIVLRLHITGPAPLYPPLQGVASFYAFTALSRRVGWADRHPAPSAREPGVRHFVLLYLFNTVKCRVSKISIEFNEFQTDLFFKVKASLVLEATGQHKEQFVCIDFYSAGWTNLHFFLIFLLVCFFVCLYLALQAGLRFWGVCF